MRAHLLLILACGSGALPIRADMVTLRSNVTYYGTLLRFTGEQLTLRAQFRDHIQKDLIFERGKLARVEFNDQKSNEGEPPAALGTHQGSAGNGDSTDSRPKDTIIFREGQNKACPSVVFDEKTIKCGDSAYDRSEGTVWRIYFADL